MNHLNRKLKRTGGRLLLLSIGFLLATAGTVRAQCPGNVDLQAVSIDPSAATVGTNATFQLVVVMRNNGPCAIPTGEAQVQITFSDALLQNAVPFNFVDNCVPARWTFLTSNTAGGLTNLFFRNNAGPIPVGGANCSFQFNVGSRNALSAGTPITLASTLTALAVSSDVDGSNQSASTTVIISVIAPVILSDISATASSCNGILDWKTSSEDNVDRFEVEYSTNGTDFAKVGTVLAKNNSNGSTYKYINDQGTTRGYYRLRMIDRDGHFTFSRIVSVDTKCSGKKTITMYPNPLTASQNLNVIASGFEGTIKGELVGLSGQVIRTYNLKNGSNTLPVDKLAQATYMLRVSDASGDTESFRVVIMK